MPTREPGSLACGGANGLASFPYQQGLAGSTPVTSTKFDNPRFTYTIYALLVRQGGNRPKGRFLFIQTSYKIKRLILGAYRRYACFQYEHFGFTNVLTTEAPFWPSSNRTFFAL